MAVQFGYTCMQMWRCFISSKKKTNEKKEKKKKKQKRKETNSDESVGVKQHNL